MCAVLVSLHRNNTSEPGKIKNADRAHGAGPSSANRCWQILEICRLNHGIFENSVVRCMIKLMLINDLLLEHNC